MHQIGTPISKRDDDQFAALVRRQFGAFSRGQALAHSVTDRQLSSRVRRGDLAAVCYGIYCVTATPDTWHRRVVVACLRGGESAFASHQCSAAAWGIEGFQPRMVEVSTQRRISQVDEATFHRVVEPPPGDVQDLGPIKVSSPTRTLIEISGSADDEGIELALDDCLRKRLTSVARLRWRLEKVGARGMRGARRLRRILDRRDNELRPETVFERKFLWLLAHAGLPMPHTQYEIRDAGGFIGRVDFAYPSARVAIEADGYRFHSGRTHWERDRTRRNRLEASGWRMLHTTWDQVIRRPDDILRPLRTLLLPTFGDQLPLLVG